MKHQKQNRSQVLMEILDNNKNTDYGRRYDFKNIKTIEQFQKNLPIACYDDYAPLIALMTRLGEKNIFTSDIMVCYTLSFSADGSARMIPCTRKYIELYAGYTGGLSDMLSSGRVFSMCASLPKTRCFSDGMYLNTISGALLTECAGKIKRRKFGTKADGSPFVNPKELLYPEGLYDYRYVRMLFALADEQVRLIIAPYTGIVIDSFRFLEENWEMLLEDIEAGTIGRHDNLPKEFWLPESVKNGLAKKLKPNPKRASELNAIFKDNFCQPAVDRIWPQLTRIVAEQSGAADINGNEKSDAEKLKRYTGNIPLNNGLYFSAEALIGASVRDNCDERILLPDAGFFEFLPVAFGAADKTCPLQMDDLKISGEYEIVVTNCLGLYRYRIGDIIRVVRKEGGVPVFSIVHRSNAAIPYHRSSETEQSPSIFRNLEKELDPVINAHC